ncbi:MAG: bifunctional (p)ppGpp synthetase/guanosine-3',5'-bis(diphosphate) 3'-pyrophosphohydrolase [candidate division FCPU426 bacterium]
MLESEQGVLEGPETYSSLPTLAEIVAQAAPGVLTPADIELLGEAYRFAETMHAGQKRASGAQYFTHAAHVALELAKIGLDVSSIAAGLLHDTLEDTAATPEQLKEAFGAEIAGLVEGVTKISSKMAPAGAELHTENLRKMLIAVARDIRVLLIKLSDRLHNLRTLSFLPEIKQRRVAGESMEVYAPLANRLGLARWKWEMEDRCMLVLYPRECEELRALIAQSQGDRHTRLSQASAKLDERLKESGIKAEIAGRSKHLWSTYQKMLRNGKKFEEIYDLVALRIITHSVQDCYATLGLVHSLWNPVPGRVKDYIAIPKSNLYQSLHTTVIGPLGLPLEVQVRTEDMHRTAERGIAAHWNYKQGGKPSRGDDTLPFLQNVLEWQRDSKDSGEFVEFLKIDLYEEEVFIFTPKGEVKMLPKGSSCIDFAYAVHSGVGDQCYGAIVNGKMAPLRHELQSGDIVSILTSAAHKPSKDWLHFAKTSKAKNRIRRFLKMDQRAEEVARGTSALEKAVRRHKLKIGDFDRSSHLLEASRQLHFGSVEDLLAALGSRELEMKTLLDKLAPAKEPASEPAHAKAAAAGAPPTSASQGVVVKGLSGMLVAFARCCNPVHGDPILGYVTVGRGVSVHRTDCVNAPDLFSKSERLVEVEWADSRLGTRPVEIEVTAFDRDKLMSDMLMAIARTAASNGQASSLSAATASTSGEGMASARFTVNVVDVDHLKRVMLHLYQLEGVSSVKRRDKRSNKKKGARAKEDDQKL